MKNNCEDKTLKKNYIQKYQFLIETYEQVKAGEHPKFTRVGEFYEFYGTCRQTFLKYYARYKQSNGDVSSLLPGKRGPKYQTRRPDLYIEKQVLALRDKGNNKYDISNILRPLLKDKTPSPSGVYNILKRDGKNKLTKPMKEVKRRIIKEKAGELAHIDCHHLSKDCVDGSNKRYYLLCIIDSCTRVAWAEVVEDIKSLTVMFSTLRCLNQLADRYNIRFAEMLTDNGPEFGPRDSKRKSEHPFERLCMEMGIKHRHTRPYRPQTNGKVERFWRTLNEDLIEGTHFESLDHLKDEVMKYMIYYNHSRAHQALGGKTPDNFNQSCQRIT